MSAEFLIVTNGYKGTWAAIEYGAALAASLQMQVTLLGVTEALNPAAIDDHSPLEDIFAEAVELFQRLDLEYTLDVRNGSVEKIVPDIANAGDFITVVGPLGRPPLRQFFTGRSIRGLLEQIKSPILYVPEARLPLKRILITVGGLGYEEAAENIGIRAASANRANITILYVVPPTDLDYPTTRKVQGRVHDLMETDTVPGRSLRRALEAAEQAGAEARVVTRQGNIVEEILGEIREGGYDLVCMGSAYSVQTLRQYYSPNVTAEVAEATRCPVLTARHRST